MKLRICKTHPNARVPEYATEGAEQLSITDRGAGGFRSTGA